MRRLKHFFFISILALTLLVVFIYQPFTPAIASSPPAVDETALQNHVRHLSVDLHPRSFDFPNNLNAAADYIKKEWQQASINVTEQTFDVQGTSYRNIIAHFAPHGRCQSPRHRYWGTL